MAEVRLTPAQQEIAKQQIKRLTGEELSCRMCGSTNVDVPARMFRLEIDGLVGAGIPVVAVHCLHCQHISIFSAAGLGVIDH